MPFKRLREMNKSELENLINRTNKEIQKLEDMKQKPEYKNNPNIMGGFDTQIQSARLDLGLYRNLLEQKYGKS